MNIKTLHATEIENYQGNMQELVNFIVGRLRYDKVIEFHQMLSDRYLKESQDETARSRPKLAEALLEVSQSEKLTTEKMKKVWEICQPYTK